jgi:hypothetical protein
MFLDSGAAYTNVPGVFSDNSSTVFEANSGVFTASATYVAYCFAPVKSYSAFGSYIGNGSAEGPFVYTGFRPQFVVIKRTDGSGNWLMLDSERLGYNGGNGELQANLADAEGTYNYIDILSNGFKVRGTDASGNASSGNYVYFAIAESPFQYARAR